MLARIEGTEHFRLEDFAEAENIRERCAELIGDVADEFGLQAVRRFERVVSVAQRLFHARRIRHVDIGHERRAVGQRHHRIVDHRAVGPVEAAGLLRADAGRAGDAVLQHFPFGVVVHQGTTHVDQLADMRLAFELFLVERPDGGVGGIGKFQAAVGAEDRNAFIEVVDGLALHAGERVVGAFEVEALGDVFIEIDDAAEGMRLGEKLDGAAVRQVPVFLDGFGRGVDFHARLLPCLEVRLFRQAAARAQLVQHLIVGGAAVEPLRVEAPERFVGAVAEGEALVGAADRDGGRDAVERRGMAFDVAAEFGFRLVEIRDVDRDSRRCLPTGAAPECRGRGVRPP